jgi:hypothetical protein
MKSAAEQPGSRLQADLMDFPKNAKSAANASHQYAVQITDVFTRQTWTKAVKDKSAAVVHPAVLSLLADIPTKPGFTFSTDGGKEFANIALPNEGIHRVKDPANRNSLAVVDASMQQVKQAIATRAARGGGGWATNLRASTDAYNGRYHSAVHGSPKEAADPGVQQFMVLQDNAAKFQHNRGLVEKKRAALERGRVQGPDSQPRAVLRAQVMCGPGAGRDPGGRGHSDRCRRQQGELQARPACSAGAS